MQVQLQSCPDLLWIAVEAMTAPLPANWSEHQTDDGISYLVCLLDCDDFEQDKYTTTTRVPKIVVGR